MSIFELAIAVAWLAVIVLLSWKHAQTVRALAQQLIVQAQENAREQARTLAQADESRKAAMCFAEKALNRLMVVRYPGNYANLRQNSGVIEGAQYSTKPHYLDDAELSAELARQQQQMELASANARAAKAGLERDLERAERLPINTNLDFERPLTNGAG